jgi:hypothetical protein
MVSLYADLRKPKEAVGPSKTTMIGVEMNKWICGMLVAAILSVPAISEAKEKKEKKNKANAEQKQGKQKKQNSQLEDLNLVGTLTSVEKEVGKGDKAKTVTQYVLKLEDGSTVPLPAKKNGPDMDAYVGKSVRVSGKGKQVDKKGKTVTMLKMISSIEAADGQAMTNDEEIDDEPMGDDTYGDGAADEPVDYEAYEDGSGDENESFDDDMFSGDEYSDEGGDE